MNDRKSAAARGYDARWRKARARFLRSNPLCVPCRNASRTTAATHVHHKTPHRGDMVIFWREEDWEGQCETCHNGDSQRAEKGGGSSYRGCDLNGRPLDPGHRWNRD